MGPVESAGEGREVLRAAARGVVGALAMSGMRTLTQSLGLVSETPPDAILGRKARGLLRRVSPKRRRAVIQTFHCGVGALGGAIFGAAPATVRRRAWAGPVYGMGIWTAYEGAVAPALGVWQEHRAEGVEAAALAADHLLYGVILSGLRGPLRN